MVIACPGIGQMDQSFQNSGASKSSEVYRNGPNYMVSKTQSTTQIPLEKSKIYYFEM